MKDNYDAWLQSDAAYDRFHGLDYDEQWERMNDIQEAMKEDEAMEEYYEQKYEQGTDIDGSGEVPAGVVGVDGRGDKGLQDGNQHHS